MKLVSQLNTGTIILSTLLAGAVLIYGYMVAVIWLALTLGGGIVAIAIGLVFLLCAIAAPYLAYHRYPFLQEFW